MTSGAGDEDRDEASTSDDLEIVARLRDGDEDGLRQVIDTLGGLVFAIAWRYLQNATLAEEVAQDVFLAIWLQPQDFDPARGSLRSYLLRITRNKAIDLVRHEQSQRAKKSRAHDLLLLENGASEADVADPSRQVEQSDVVREALSKLTDLQREIIEMVYFGGRTCREASEELGLPESTAKTRLRDALMKLRDLRKDL